MEIESNINSKISATTDTSQTTGAIDTIDTLQTTGVIDTIDTTHTSKTKAKTSSKTSSKTEVKTNPGHHSYLYKELTSMGVRAEKSVLQHLLQENIYDSNLISDISKVNRDNNIYLFQLLFSATSIIFPNVSSESLACLSPCPIP